MDQISTETDEETGASSGSMKMSGSTKTRLHLKSPSHTLMNMGMEIDPTKLDEAADPKVNTLQLWLTAQKIFSAITRTRDELPKELVYVVPHLCFLLLSYFSRSDLLIFVHDEVKQKFPGEEVIHLWAPSLF